MKFQYKALVAALALSAATVPAQAAMEKAITGNSSFVLSLWNQVSGTSATFDLGYNYSSFADLTTASINLSTGDYADVWNTFIAASTSGTTKWAIYAGDNLGSLRTPGELGYYTTANSTDGMSQLSSTSALQNVMGNMDIYLGAANNVATGNHNSVANGANTSTLTADAGAGGSSAYGTGKTGAAGPVAGADIGDSLYMLKITGQGRSAPTASFMTNASGANYEFVLSSNGVLSAVPEADSYAMLLAGLGVLGLVARRRKA